MDVVWSKMQRYRLARKLMPPPAIVPDVFDVEIRSKVEGQHRLALEVARYGNAIIAALRGMLAAQEALELQGLDAALRPPVGEQTRRLRDALAKVQATVESCTSSAAAHAKLFAACMSHFEKADKLAAEARWYKQKMEALTGEDVVDFEVDEDQGGSPKLVRNRGKLARTHKEAGVAQANASTALDACITRVPKLQSIVRELVAGTVDALRISAGESPTTTFTPVWNPFDCDVEDQEQDVGEEDVPDEMHTSIAAKRRSPATFSQHIPESVAPQEVAEGTSSKGDPLQDSVAAVRSEPLEEDNFKISKEDPLVVAASQQQGDPRTKTEHQDLRSTAEAKAEMNSAVVIEKEVPGLDSELSRDEMDKDGVKPRKIRALQLHKLLAGWSPIPEQLKREDSHCQSVEGHDSHEPESEAGPERGSRILL